MPMDSGTETLVERFVVHLIGNIFQINDFYYIVWYCFRTINSCSNHDSIKGNYFLFLSRFRLLKHCKSYIHLFKEKISFHHLRHHYDFDCNFGFPTLDLLNGKFKIYDFKYE